MGQEMPAHAVVSAEKGRDTRKYLPESGKCSEATAELGSGDSRRIPGNGCGIEDNAVASEERFQRQDCIVRQCVRRDGRCKRSAHRINTAGGIEERINFGVPGS